jgi:DNA-binding transcriptional MerR regulator
MKIGELAERVGLKVETIRFYEKEGLLCSPHRSTVSPQQTHLECR